jgi:hypothetical protein
MPSTVARPPQVRQYDLGAAAKLTNVPPGVVATRLVGTADWTYGDSEATAIFPVPAGQVEEIPTAAVRDIYFAGSGQLIVAFYLG